MTAGILKEPQAENRVSLLPEQAELLAKQKANVIVEKNAGINAFVNDELYIAKGCQLALRKEILQKSSTECTGNLFIDEDVLAKEGITDLEKYSVRPGGKLFNDLFV